LERGPGAHRDLGRVTGERDVPDLRGQGRLPPPIAEYTVWTATPAAAATSAIVVLAYPRWSSSVRAAWSMRIRVAVACSRRCGLSSSLVTSSTIRVEPSSTRRRLYRRAMSWMSTSRRKHAAPTSP
jgi:SnoaL-like polyketide cyclase